MEDLLYEIRATLEDRLFSSDINLPISCWNLYFLLFENAALKEDNTSIFSEKFLCDKLNIEKIVLESYLERLFETGFITYTWEKWIKYRLHFPDEIFEST